jgi:nitrate reductase gamma subunit
MDISYTIFGFTFNILPWITYLIFSVGMIAQIIKWNSGAPSLATERKKNSLKDTLKIFILDFVIQRKMLKKNFKSLALWVISWLTFHLPLAMILFGHLRGFGVWQVEWFTWLAPKEFLKEILPFMTGLALLGGSFLLLIRRLLLKAPRSMSNLENYLVLFLVISVISAGDIMRLLPHSPEPLSFTIPPGFTMNLDNTPSIIFLAFHGIIAQLIVMYLPFSKLIHMIGSLITTIARIRVS